MTASYIVRLKSQTGNYVALFDTWIALNFNHRVDEVGTFRLEIDGNDNRRQFFALDGQVEVWRRDLDVNLDWYIEWEGFVRTRTLMYTERGEVRYIAYASSYLNLIGRRQIAYYADIAQTSKAGAAETVIKEFVEENAGPSAVSPPRLYDGVTPGLTVQADAAAGDFWTGNRAWKPLLEVIREIAEDKGVDFDVIGTGPAQFQFVVYPGQRGVDRSLEGYSEATGLNGAGNRPVVFSFASGNLVQPEATLHHADEVTVVFVLGQGQNEQRTVTVRTDPAATAQSPWNKIEDTTSTQETLVAALQVIGDRMLIEHRAQESFNFDILSLANRVYGRDFTWGDLVGAIFDGVEYNKKIVEVSITVAENGDKLPEQISYTIADFLES